MRSFIVKFIVIRGKKWQTKCFYGSLTNHIGKCKKKQEKFGFFLVNLRFVSRVCIFIASRCCCLLRIPSLWWRMASDLGARPLSLIDEAVAAAGKVSGLFPAHSTICPGWRQLSMEWALVIKSQMPLWCVLGLLRPLWTNHHHALRVCQRNWN